LSSKKLYALFLSILAALSASVLWAFSNNQQVGDSLGIAYYVSIGQDISNPHHLLFGPIVWLLYQFIGLFIIIDVLSTGQLHNIAWAVVAIVSLSAIVKHYTQNIWLAFFSGLVLLVSHQFWQYSTQFEVYVPALSCLSLLLLVVVKAGERPIATKTIIITIILLFFSICYHQMGVLFLLPLAVLFYWQWGSAGIKGIIIVSVVTGSICIVAYATVYLVMYGNEPSVAGFMRYCVMYAYSNPDWGTFQHFSKSYEIARIFDNVTGSFLAPYWAAKVPTWAIAAALGVIAVWHTLAVVRKWVATPIRATFLLWLAVYFLFLLWWTPGYEFFVMLVWPILFLLIIMGYDLAVLAAKPTLLPAAFAAILAIGLLKVNANSFKHYHYEHDEGYYKAAEAIDLSKGNCWVITNFNVMLNLMYFHNYHQTIESDGLAIDYYMADSITPEARFDKMDCVLVEMWYYNPWYSPLGENGFTKPEDWLRLNANLFRFETDSNRHLTSTASFDVLQGQGRVPYLLVDRTRTTPIAGYQAFFARMDSLTALHGLEKDVSYLNWYEQHKGLMNE
jgi:hypothetical protein